VIHGHGCHILAGSWQTVAQANELKTGHVPTLRTIMSLKLILAATHFSAAAVTVDRRVCPSRYTLHLRRYAVQIMHYTADMLA